MDLTFRLPAGTFNFRVAAVMIHRRKLLVMYDPQACCWYLPGGRVHLHESAEDALVRELREELGVSAKPLRPLWLVQNFYREAVTREQYHELCLYLLTDISQTDLLCRGDSFTTVEAGQRNTLRWVPFADLQSICLYPLFLKQAVFTLPEHLRFVTERR